MVRRKEDYYPEMIPEVTPISEVLAIAQKMHGIFPMAIVSRGQDEQVDATLDALGITKMFQTIISVEDYVNCKPAPGTISRRRRKHRLVATEYIVFEDGPTGIEAAKADGMAWFFVPSGNIL